MATAEKLTEDYLTCAICTDVFTKPAILDCDHTFCRKCLLEYIKTQPDAVRAKSIPCAVCRQMTKVTSPEKPVEEWVNQVKPSRLIQGLIDDFGQNLEVDDNLMEKKQQFVCRTHKDEDIKLFCKDCKKAICHLCCAIDHRYCKGIISIKEALPEITSGILSTKNKLEERITKTKGLIAKRNANMSHFKEEATQVASDIKTAGRMAVSTIEAKEQKLIQKLNEMKLAYTLQQEAKLTSDEAALNSYQSESDLIDRAVKCGSAKDICILFEKDEAEATRDDHEVSVPDKIKFKWEPDELGKIVEDIKLGNVYCVKAGDVGRETSPTLQQVFDMTTPSDKSTPDIQDVVVIQVEHEKLLVFIDRKNKTIKSFNIGDIQGIRGMLSFDVDPFGLAVTGENEVQVTLPFRADMHKIRIFPEMDRVASISLERRLYGIQHIGQNKLVACRDPLFGKSSLDLTDMDGTVLKTLELPTLTLPRYVCKSGPDTFLVAEHMGNSLHVISYQDNVSNRCFQIPNVKNLRGIITTSTGDVLVVGRDTNNVIQLTSSGDFVREILTSADGIDKPRGICMDKDGLVYVTCGKFVKVYRFH